MEFYNIGLSDVMTGMESFPGFNTVVEPRIAASASRGKRSIMRFYMDYPQPEGSYVSHTPPFLKNAPYNLQMTEWNSTALNVVGLSPDYSDEHLKTALSKFVTALGDRYDGDLRVGFVQVGLLGFWGEWHTWTEDSATHSWIPDATKVALIDAFDNAFQTTQVQMPQGVIDGEVVGVSLPLPPGSVVTKDTRRLAANEPSQQPSKSSEPSSVPSKSAQPSSEPSLTPSKSAQPSSEPSLVPSKSSEPSSEPSLSPSKSSQPSSEPSLSPSVSSEPSPQTSLTPSKSAQPSSEPLLNQQSRLLNQVWFPLNRSSHRQSRVWYLLSLLSHRLSRA